MIRTIISTVVFLTIVVFAKAQQKTDTINRFDSSGLKIGKWIGRFDETKHVAAIEYYVAGKKNGLCKYFTDDGYLEYEIEYLKDTINGLWKYYPNTGQKIVSEMRNGQREGMTRLYDYKGRLVEEYEYHSDIANGLFRSFHRSGRVAAKGQYLNGKETGRRVVYNDKKKAAIVIEIDYTEGRRIERRFYKKRKLIKTEKFDAKDELMDEQKGGLHIYEVK
jgi:antitoxin component YwqK of YwqJK toxin-antitoxin module